MSSFEERQVTHGLIVIVASRPTSACPTIQSQAYPLCPKEDTVAGSYSSPSSVTWSGGGRPPRAHPHVPHYDSVNRFSPREKRSNAGRTKFPRWDAHCMSIGHCAEARDCNDIDVHGRVTPQICIPWTADLAPSNRRARAMSITLSGLISGLVIGRVVAGVISNFASWRDTYWDGSGLARR